MDLCECLDWCRTNRVTLVLSEGITKAFITDGGQPATGSTIEEVVNRLANRKDPKLIDAPISRQRR